MEKIEKKISDDILIEALNKNCIDRNVKLKKFIEFLNMVDGNTIISLDGEWGSGKTWFVKQADIIINYYNNSNKEDSKLIEEKQQTEISKGGLKKISEINEFSQLKNIIENNSINSIYFSAWEHDDEEDPILSVVYEIIKKFPKKLQSETKIAGNNLLDILKILVKTLSKGNIDIDNINSNHDLLEAVKQKYQTKQKIQEIFNIVIDEKCNKLVLFVDEIDRCIPLYAVKMLERLKHYITDERIVIVISTNLKELGNTIGNLYGNQETSMNYLDKFIDYRLIIPKCDMKKYYKSIYPLINKENYWYVLTLRRTMEYKNMSLRQMNRYVDYMKLFEKNLFTSVINNNYELDENLFLKYLIVPYMVGLFLMDHTEYVKFINGNGLEEFTRYATSKEIKSFMLESLDINDEEYLTTIKSIYEYISKSDKKEPLKINSHIINQEDIFTTMNYFNILGEFSDFENE